MRIALAGLFIGSLAGSAFGQSVTSVSSGVVHYVDGSAFLGDKAVELKFGQFPSVKANETLRTSEGRAEVLLVPGTVLRLGENSAIRMINTKLSDTKLELLQGEIVIEAVDGGKDATAQMKGNQVTVIAQGSTTTFPKPGLYSFSTEPSRLRVFEGEAVVTGPSGQLTLKKGKETQLNGMLMAVKFDPKVGDELMRWSSRRSGYLATANMAAARSLSNGASYGGGMWSSYMGNGGWTYNPMFGMYTFVPFGGIAYSPFGYNYWSPYAFNRYYLPNLYNNYYGGGGGGGGGNYGGGNAASGPARNVGGNSAVAASHHSNRTAANTGFDSSPSMGTSSRGDFGAARGGYSAPSISSGAGDGAGASMGGGSRGAVSSGPSTSAGAPAASTGGARGR